MLAAAVKDSRHAAVYQIRCLDDSPSTWYLQTSRRISEERLALTTHLPTVSLKDARALVLSSQGLCANNGFGSAKNGALEAILRLSYVQIDTISVVERAHHHVIWSRVKDYRPPDLHALHSCDRNIFEYWSHAASYLPFRDYRFSLPTKKAYAEGKNHWFRSNKKLMTFVLNRIAADGPLQAKDFEAPKGHKSAGWFDWKPAKRFAAL